MIEYAPLPYQEQFHNSSKPKVYLSTGFGGGKTYALIMKMFDLMDRNPHYPGGILCPTTKMYKRDVLPTILDICTENEIRHSYNKTEMLWYFPQTDSTVYLFHSEDEGRSIRGPNLAWAAINEVTLCHENAFKALLSRIRVKKAKRLQLVCSGTPESFNWAYQYFIENPRQDTELIFGDARVNTYVADDYFQMLIDSYDELMVQQYVKGEFVDLTGKRCVYAFNRQRHTSPNIDKLHGYPVLVSLDFNVTPMAAVLWNRIPFGKKDAQGYGMRGPQTGEILRAFDEICISNSNTYEVCRAIREKTSPSDQIIIYPDPAGSARSTKSINTSDIDILEQAGFEDIRYKSKIRVKDCLNATNAMFAKDAIVLNSDKCRNAIADLEQCKFKEGLFEIDKSDLKRTHWLDGMKCMIDYEFPVVGRGGFREERYR
jgi:hypothetical protein